MAFSGAVASNLHNQNGERIEGRLFKSFKLKAQQLHTKSNLLSDESLLKMCESSAKSLETLIIRSSHYLSTQGLLKSISYLKSLKHLDISYTHNISDYFVVGFAANTDLTSSLESISLRLLRGITSSSVITLIRKASRLRSLDISGCKQLENTGIFSTIGRSRIEKL